MTRRSRKGSVEMRVLCALALRPRRPLRTPSAVMLPLAFSCRLIASRIVQPFTAVQSVILPLTVATGSLLGSLCTSVIFANFEFALMPNLYASFSDGQAQQWSVAFRSQVLTVHSASAGPVGIRRVRRVLSLPSAGTP